MFLKNIQASHIDYLVDVLTDNGGTRIALPAAIKDLLHSEKEDKKYTEKSLRHLLHEFQNYGGHSIGNICRNILNKEPPSYAEILTDVHKKLNGTDSKNKPTQQKEREIVFGLFGNEWETLPDHTRWERCTELQVLSGFFNMNKNLNFDEKGAVIGFSSVASAAVLIARGVKSIKAFSIPGAIGLAAQSMGEAYRITIPFTAHIAMLKMIYTSKPSHQ